MSANLVSLIQICDYLKVRALAEEPGGAEETILVPSAHCMCKCLWQCTEEVAGSLWENVVKGGNFHGSVFTGRPDQTSWTQEYRK